MSLNTLSRTLRRPGAARFLPDRIDDRGDRARHPGRDCRPSYQQYIRQSHRAWPRRTWWSTQRAERYYSVNNTYSGFALPSKVSPREADHTLRDHVRWQGVLVHADGDAPGQPDQGQLRDAERGPGQPQNGQRHGFRLLVNQVLIFL
jgi:hypothetical protein